MDSEYFNGAVDLDVCPSLRYLEVFHLYLTAAWTCLVQLKYITSKLSGKFSQTILLRRMKRFFGKCPGYFFYRLETILNEILGVILGNDISSVSTKVADYPWKYVQVYYDRPNVHCILTLCSRDSIS